MANVPLDTRFIGISPNVNLTERKSASINAETQPYTMSDIVETAGGGCLKYVATISQSGEDAPVPTVLENTLGAPLVWNRSSEGDYHASIETPDFFTRERTILFVSADYYDGNAAFAYLTYQNASGLYLTTFNVTGDYADFNTTLSIEIRVYP